MTDATNVGYTCPRYERCNAPWCPALGGHQLDGEPVCFYMREIVKAGGEARLTPVLPEALLNVVRSEAQRLLSCKGPIQRPLLRASHMGSKMEAGFRQLRFLKPEPACS